MFVHDYYSPPAKWIYLLKDFTWGVDRHEHTHIHFSPIYPTTFPLNVQGNCTFTYRRNTHNWLNTICFCSRWVMARALLVLRVHTRNSSPTLLISSIQVLYVAIFRKETPSPIPSVASEARSWWFIFRDGIPLVQNPPSQTAWH